MVGNFTNIKIVNILIPIFIIMFTSLFDNSLIKRCFISFGCVFREGWLCSDGGLCNPSEYFHCVAKL